VLSGPPGTGKTHTATRAARSWVDDHTDGEPSAEQVRTVTFHPAFAYEDFLEGLTAETTDDGDVVYDEEPGHLYEIAEDAREAYDPTADTNPPYVLVVDEINRGDLPQILGEAITLLEPGERGDHEIDLAHSGDSFTLPPNLYLIGTMNTADQSIGLVDAALRRRFRFLRFPPEPERVAEIELDDADGASAVLDDPAASQHERLVAASVLALSELNDRIRTEASRLERGQQLGHTALLGHDAPRDVADAWRFQLLPQLAEYYYGQTESLRRELFDGGDSPLFDWEHGTVGEFDPQTLYDALCDLADADAVEFDAGAGDGEPDDAVDGEATTTASDE
jgi:GTPase subunit of restriction endonuclease